MTGSLFHPERPRIKPSRPAVDYVLEVVAALLLVGMLALTLLSFGQLPEQIPTHYNAAGAADAFGARWTLLILPVVGAVLWGLLTLVNRFPHLWNYPVKITEHNAASQYRRGRTFMALLKVEVMGMFTYLVWGTIQTANAPSPQLNPLVLWGLMGIVLLTLVVFIILTLQDRDPNAA
jgi:uncharacterized membrane protein